MCVHADHRAWVGFGRTLQRKKKEGRRSGGGPVFIAQLLAGREFSRRTFEVSLFLREMSNTLFAIFFSFFFTGGSFLSVRPLVRQECNFTAQSIIFSASFETHRFLMRATLVGRRFGSYTCDRGVKSCVK